MKKFIFSLFAMAILVSCQSNKQKDAVDDSEIVEFVEADSTGWVDVWAYEGVVPAKTNKKDSIAYMVIITQKLDSVNGVYQMTTTYIAADSTKQKTVNSRGRKWAHRGTKHDHNAAVYKLVPDSGSNQTVNLWVESDTSVVLLDDQLNKPANPEKYRLKSKN